jgi:hypothetical protein
MIVYSRSLIQRLTSWAEAVPQAIYGEAAARITELERENAALRAENAEQRNHLITLTFNMRDYGTSLIDLADTYKPDALKQEIAS